MAQRAVLFLVALGVLASVSPVTAQCPDGTPPPCRSLAAPPPARSVAVLTFENVSRDSAAQYVAEGLADQIATRLGGVARLTVISRSAVRRLRDPDRQSLQQLGRALNVSFLVSGAIRAASGRVRVNVEAVRAATGEAVWAEAYDRASGDLIGLEEAIATAVAAEVAGRLSPQERRALAGPVTTSSPAYAELLRGNALLARRSVTSLLGAIAAYRAAAADDPGLADAQAHLAYASVLCIQWGCADTDSLLTLARLAAARALRLSPRSSDAWMAEAYRLAIWNLLGRSHGDDSLLAALAAFRRAVALNPRNAEAWHQYGATLQLVDDSASIDALRRALAIDPTRAISYSDLAFTYYQMGWLDRALAASDSALALEPDGAFRGVRMLIRLAAGDTAGALADARLVPALPPARAALAAFAHDSASIRQMDSAAAPSGCGFNELPLYPLWTGRYEQAVAAVLGCGPSLATRSLLRWPPFAPLATDPRIRALRAASDSILARARWK
jgi:TolB-like protein